MMGDLHRHDLVWLDATGWQALYEQYHFDVLKEWEAKNFPLIVTQQPMLKNNDDLLLGLPLPPTMGKARISLISHKHYISKTTPPPLLSELARYAPYDWQNLIKAMIQIDANFRVFGSLCWQALTNMHYISKTSDLDLCLAVLPRQDYVLNLCNSIESINKTALMRIDVELIRPKGGVHYQEILRQYKDDIIVKTNTGVVLMPFATWVGENEDDLSVKQTVWSV
ncbi:malonate decarboxylase holo-[acyl-carrier-protein] synthase [Bartonella sp. HY406]|uniref:malonate decarboxylase holo-[acyl-carrier-protein] synthase n=1 Tax=Bartonella sp. HY406 TaxID=2979331 RepID=UPI0021CAB4BF|nr:malonate decarboxylase holo-[acyl-carrier-protein] synthase [Bartonella sp. HY406]UXN03226.1 malonate decarboxylase holo-[acyl-carrier-protein] synthase [Bartonella sp. HY406]